MTTQRKKKADSGKLQDVVSNRDAPVGKAEEDRLERGNFISRLANAVINPKTQQSTGVVVGVTGPWGSGKSSILNLLRLHIIQTYPDALVVRFDPWLISGRNDLITEFINELLATIGTGSKNAKLKKFAGALAKYGQHLAPAVSLLSHAVPGTGVAAAGAMKALEIASGRNKSIQELRSTLMKALAEVEVPIVVLIDELDRVEDSEIKTVAQLVRAVADFSGMSYVLAFDVERVIQALGSGIENANERAERGRAYLEKIVQFQIPLPITFDNELETLLFGELEEIGKRVPLPEAFRRLERYQAMCSLLIPDIISTPRDVKRLTGTYHTMMGLVGEEVDWLDLLGLCALLVKSPQTVEKIRRDPDFFVVDALTTRSVLHRLSGDKDAGSKQLDDASPEGPLREAVRRMLVQLFPILDDRKSAPNERPNALAFRHPLVTALRLGLPPGAWSLNQISELVKETPDQVAKTLARLYSEDSIGSLVERLKKVYTTLTDFDAIGFWRGVGKFLRKPDQKWINHYEPIHSIITEFARILHRSASEGVGFKEQATKVYWALSKDDETSISARVLRLCMYAHGHTKEPQPQQGAVLLNSEETLGEAKRRSAEWKEKHLAGTLLPSLWDLQPIYTMVDVKVWDDECRDTLFATLKADNAALDGLALMFFGGSYTTDRSTIEDICGYDRYIALVSDRLAKYNSYMTHESINLALRKGLGQF